MSPREETERMLETSEERRNRRVDALLEDPAVKAAVQQNQRQQAVDEDNRPPRRKFA
jgi:hypothetical protein